MVDLLCSCIQRGHGHSGTVLRISVFSQICGKKSLCRRVIQAAGTAPEEGVLDIAAAGLVRKIDQLHLDAVLCIIDRRHGRERAVRILFLHDGKVEII